MVDDMADEGYGRGGSAEAEAALRVAYVGTLVRARRERLGLTVVRLSATTGISRRFISELEDGKSTVQLGRALLVCEAVGIDIVEALRRHMAPGRPAPPTAACGDDELPDVDDADEGPSYPSP